MSPLSVAVLHVTTLLLMLSPCALSARISVNTTLEEVGQMDQECGREVAVPGDALPLQQYFDGLRESYGILSQEDGFLGEDGVVEPGKCTKRDVCLLMRQLDMDFYQRARQGLLQDIDYTSLPTLGWVNLGSCQGQDETRGFKMRAVTDEETCRRQAKKKKAAYQGVVSKTKLPQGCVIKIVDDGKKTTTKAYLNTEPSGVQSGVSYYGIRKTEKMVLCEMDRSLSESAAAYFSPYKLKPSMVGTEAKSTSCSFGMYALLARLRETRSPCAKILTYRAHERYPKRDDALAAAEDLKAAGKVKEAENLRAYAESIRQKEVLMSVVTKNWCPGIWIAAQQADKGVCSAPRVMEWTAEAMSLLQAAVNETRLPGYSDQEKEDKAAEHLLESLDSNKADSSAINYGKPIKVALTELSCQSLEDDTLDKHL